MPVWLLNLLPAIGGLFFRLRGGDRIEALSGQVAHLQDEIARLKGDNAHYVKENEWLRKQIPPAKLSDIDQRLQSGSY